MEEKLSIDHLLAFIKFNEHNVATIVEGENAIKVIKDDKKFKILENGIYLKSIDVNNCYLYIG